MSYYYSRQLNKPMDEVEAMLRANLAQEGFGVLSDIDVQATLKKKLGIDSPPYKILGACNPQFAHRAMQVEPRIGVMLPCNVILRALEDDTVEVAAVDPVASMQAIANPELQEVAGQVREKLRRVVDSLE